MDAVAVLAGLLGERAAEPRLAGAARSRDEQAAVAGIQRQAAKPLEQCLVENGVAPGVDAFDGRLAVPKLGALERARRKRLVERLAASRSSAAPAIRRAPGPSIGLGSPADEGGGHAVELERRSWSSVGCVSIDCFSSTVVLGATDVVVSYRRPVRGGFGSSAIQVVLQDGVDGGDRSARRSRAPGRSRPRALAPVRRRGRRMLDASIR